jgi:hypothetical protein
LCYDRLRFHRGRSDWRYLRLWFYRSRRSWSFHGSTRNHFGFLRSWRYDRRSGLALLRLLSLLERHHI